MSSFKRSQAARQQVSENRLPDMPPPSVFTDGYCCALVGGSDRKAGGATNRTERCRNRATTLVRQQARDQPAAWTNRTEFAVAEGALPAVRYDGPEIPVCRVHEGLIERRHSAVVPIWWMWPQDLLGHLESILKRSGTDPDGFLLKNLQARIE